MSTVAKKIMMGSGAVAEAYEIEQSVIFNKLDSSYMVRTPSSTGNRRTWTLSVWLKKTDVIATGNADSYQFIYGGQSAHETSIRFVNNQIGLNSWTGSAYEFNWTTTRQFRDTSAWFHLVVAFDSTQGTNTNRIKVYINGEQETPTTVAYPDQNLDTRMNLSGLAQYIGRYYTTTSGEYLDYNGYMAEFNWLDGTAAAPSSFGETNSATEQWIPKEYSGSYGTNGFYLKFVSGAIGTDSSGEGNNQTVGNIANYDVVTDSPTNNFCTYDGLIGSDPLVVRSFGNLYAPLRANTSYPGQNRVSGTMRIPTSGKWYWEIRYQSSGRSGCNVGIRRESDGDFIGASGVYGYSYYNALGGKKNYNGTTSAYGAEWYDNNATYKISVYYDADLGKIGFKLNGSDQGFAFTDVVSTSYVAGVDNSAGNSTNIINMSANFGQNGAFGGAETAQGNADANGIGDFYYAPPSGYLALCTANLPDPAIALPSAHFNTVLYTGTGATPQTVTGVGFQPDFVWIKNRPTGATNYVMYDAVRGTNKTVASSTTNAESSDDTAGFSAFTSDGFTLRSLTTAQGTQNTLNQAHVAWNWKANGSGSTDTSGDIDAVVSANQTAGFSIVTWTANGSNTATIPHGLGVTPEIIFYKARSASGNWNTWTTAIDGSNDSLLLNTTGAKSDNSGIYGNLTSSVFPNWGLGNGTTQVAYAFASKPGFSKMGSYTGNGNASGPMVNTGFKPAWVMVKRTDVAKDWIILDVKRDIDNVANHRLFPNLADAEATAQLPMDILSNGFKLRISDSNYNANAGTYLYMAFAESPFKTANAR